MPGFEHIRFKGSFRDYQQRVLDNSDKYLKDGKINIVAAPGSGKTVLGLELIRRIGEPCVVFSPTTAIRRQWGERFRDLFIDSESDFEKLFSEDLHDVKLLNSVTYQALYTAMEKTPSPDSEDDCSDLDIFEVIKRSGIKTLCLDEAHHLKNEWQKALEKFISAIGGEVSIISLTATPPYDSDAAEWKRYIDVCGEIDEEIFVPELVGQNTLCPHQDYVYFNYPTKTETESFRLYKERAKKAVDEIGRLSYIKTLADSLNGEKDREKLFSSAKEYIALIILLDRYGFSIDKKLIRKLTLKSYLPPFEMKYAEIAIQFLLCGDLISDSEKAETVAVLKANSVYEKRKVSLVLSEKIKRTLISSVGKLDSIIKIVRCEINSMGERLRMLILTDYIKKENVKRIATAEEFDSVNSVSIFETVRRDNPNVKLGVLTGSLVILPDSADISAFRHKKERIENTDYCTVQFGSTYVSVDCVGKLFESGEIQILVGTKSLLGEGWDSPCINCLISASFVGSFVSSNQMRGRAIRTDKDDPDKTANIWHLVTLEPEYLIKDKISERAEEYLYRDSSEIHSCDYEILKRRFDFFMGPNYTTGEIESGIERITAIKPPYDKNGIERINAQMTALAAKRGEMKQKWLGEVADRKFSVCVEIDAPDEKRVPVFNFFNFSLLLMLSAADSLSLVFFIQSVISGRTSSLLYLLLIAVMAAATAGLSFVLKKMIIHSNPAKSIKALGVAVYKTLCDCGMISPSAKVRVTSDKRLFFVSAYLTNASVRDQNIFNSAVAEMLSPIENPRYILIAKRGFLLWDYSLSFACPSVIGKNNEYVQILAKHLSRTTGKFEPVYAYGEEGRELIIKCRKKSYITFNQRSMQKKYKVSHWE